VVCILCFALRFLYTAKKTLENLFFRARRGERYIFCNLFIGQILAYTKPIQNYTQCNQSRLNTHHPFGLYTGRFLPDRAFRGAFEQQAAKATKTKKIRRPKSPACPDENCITVSVLTSSAQLSSNLPGGLQH
jgi:hypothetical protein